MAHLRQIKLSSLEKLIKSKCRSKTSRYNQIGKLYQKYGQQTIANYTKAIEYDNTYAISYYNRAKLYSNKEQEKALDDYTMAIQLGITGPKVYQLRGYIYYKQNQFQLALKDANKVIQLDKNNSFGYYLKGIIYENKKLLKQAIHNYSKLIQCDELYQAAYIRRGSTYFQTDECQKALLDFNEIILLLFQFEIKKNNQKIFYLNKGSIEKFDQVYSMTHLQMYFNRGLLDKKIRFIKRALDDFNFVLSQNPQRFKIYVERSEIYYQLGDMRSLQIDLKRAQQGLLKNVQSNIQIEFSYLYLGRIYLMRKDYQKSKEYFTKSIQINPNQDSYIYRGIVNNLLQAYEEQDQDYQAIFNSQRNG